MPNAIMAAAAVIVWNPFHAQADELALAAAIAVSTFILLDVLTDAVLEPLYRRIEARRAANVRRILSRRAGR